MAVCRHVWGACFLLATVAAGDALADGPAPPRDRAPSRDASQGAGLAVLAGHDAVDAAWPLAQQLYARGALRPPALDEVRARVLAGEQPAGDAPPAVRDLAEMRDAIRGDDAPSRQLLLSIAHQLHVRGLLVVRLPVESVRSPVPVARVFLADTGTFDAASYGPDAASARAPSDASGTAAGTKPTWIWSGTVGSLERVYGGASPTSPAASSASQAPRAALTATPPRRESPSNTRGGAQGSEKASHPFYTSPWFWGAIGVAALGGVGIFLATRDGSSDTIHLQMQVPR